MSIYTANSTGNFSTAATWDLIRNTPIIHSTTNVSITTAGVKTVGFTAPNTTNAATGVWVFVVTYPAAGRDWTATLEESGVATAAVATIVQTDMPILTGWIYFRLGTPYVYTTTGAAAYKWIIASTVANSGSVAAEVAGSPAYLSSEDTTGTPTTTDQVWIGPHNCVTGLTVTVDGTSGDIRGTANTGNPRSITLGCWLGGGLTDSLAVLKWDTAASATLLMAGDFYISDGGEWQMGTVATPYPTANIATLTRRQTSGTSFKTVQRGTGKVILQGAPKSYYVTTYVSGTGVAASPLVVSDAVDWSVGDEVVVTATSANATNYNENEVKFIITKNSATSYVLSSTSGGSESAFTYTHDTNAKVLNITRNVNFLQITNANNNLNTQGTVDGYFKFKWARFHGFGIVGGTAALNSNYGLYIPADGYGDVDYCVFDICVAYGLIVRSRIAKTYTGNIFVRGNNSPSGVTAGIGTDGANLTFVDNYFIRNDGYAVDYAGSNCTFTNPTAIGNNLDGDADGGAFYFTEGGPAIITGANIHANRVAGLSLSSTFNTTVTNSDIGNKGANEADVRIVSQKANKILFSNCNMGSSTTVSNYLNGAVGSTLVLFDKLNQTENNHRWYTNYGSARSTGATLGDTTVRTSGTLNVRMDSEDITTGFSFEYKVLAVPGLAVSALGFIQKNTAFGTDVALVELFLPGSTVADDSQTMSNTTGSYLVYNLAAIYSGTISRYATVRITAKTITSAAYLYVADIYNGTNHITDLTTWNNGQPSDIMFEQLGDSAAVWAVLTSTLTTTGTTGNLLTKLLTVAKFIGLK